MNVVHLFDRYLNSTMNWAYHLIRHCPDTETGIAAPIVIDNNFANADFHVWRSPFQWRHFHSEWEVTRFDRLLARATRTLYQEYLYRQWKNSPPDLLHAHFAQVGVACMPLARRIGRPLVVSFYGYDYQKLPRQQPVYLEHYRQLFTQAAAVLVEGPHGREILLSLGCSPEKIFRQPLGIEPQRIPYFSRKKKKGELQLLQAATFTEKKGYFDTLRAFHRAMSDCPNMRLTLVGEPLDRPLRQMLETYVLEHGLAEKVCFLDFVPYAEFHEFLRLAQVFIHPSRHAADGDCEGGAPIVLLDAQASGLPVISTTHCDIPIEVVDGQTGLLSLEKEVDALAAHIRRFYHMGPEEYEHFSRAARNHVEQHFDVVDCGRQLHARYLEVLALRDRANR